MELRQKLMLLKSQNGLTTDALSERSGVPKGTINKLLNGATRNPTAGTLRRLAEALGCPVEALMSRPEDAPPARRLSEYDLLDRRLTEDDAFLSVARHSVPLLSVPSSGRSVLCEDTLESAGDLTCDFALRAADDSMTGARIREGDLVFIRRQSDVDDGQIAAVSVRGLAVLRRVYHVPSGLQLLCENSKYPPMLFTRPELDSVRILGLAVGFQSRLP